MRIIGKVDGTVDRSDRAFFWFMSPFDLAITTATVRAIFAVQSNQAVRRGDGSNRMVRGAYAATQAFRRGVPAVERGQ